MTTRWHADEWQHRAIWLTDYQVHIESKVVKGVKINLSGLTFNPATGTLFSVVNRPAKIIELSTEGDLIRAIPVVGISDLEGITHVRDQVFILADEAKHQLYRVEIGPGSNPINVEGLSRTGLAFDQSYNKGIEGLSWDAARQRLFIANEKMPLRILQISGLQGLSTVVPIDLQILEWLPEATWITWLVHDLSSLTLHEATGHLLLLSDESRMIIEYAHNGTPVSMMMLKRGQHGLKHDVPQAEGLTVGTDGSIYVVSEPNLFYRFEPPKYLASSGPGF
jgi:uncharacterized protein YjiK